ncbi:MAG: hypothetical protein LBI34_03995 [Puniceicoccales bacterium]|jgi:hypothetical protein|nr:hypothetical protein [Puniceicoccales bacterium]
MQESISHVDNPQANRDMGVGQRLDSGHSLVQDQDLKRFSDAFNRRDGDRSALRRLAAAFMPENSFEKDSLSREVNLQKGRVNEKADSESDPNPSIILETGIPLIEANTAQVNPIIFHSPVAEVRHLAQKVVNVLLIHDAILNEKQEITVSLKDCLLEGADVSIFRDGDALHVSFSSLNEDMATIVKLNQETLRQALLEKTDSKDVKISTSLREEGDTNHGRSRGYAGFLASDDEEETDSMGRRIQRHGRVTRKSAAGNA